MGSACVFSFQFSLFFSARYRNRFHFAVSNSFEECNEAFFCFCLNFYYTSTWSCYYLSNVFTLGCNQVLISILVS